MTAVPCDVVGVYATVHAEDGDHRALLFKVDVDCEVVTFWFKTTGVSGMVMSATLHLGVKACRLDVGPVDVDPNEDVILSHRVRIDEMVGVTQ